MTNVTMRGSSPFLLYTASCRSDMPRRQIPQVGPTMYSMRTLPTLALKSARSWLRLLPRTTYGFCGASAAGAANGTNVSNAPAAIRDIREFDICNSWQNSRSAQSRRRRIDQQPLQLFGEHCQHQQHRGQPERDVHGLPWLLFCTPLGQADPPQPIGAPEGPGEDAAGHSEDVGPKGLPAGHRDRARYTQQRDRPRANAAKTDERCEHAEAHCAATGGHDLLPFLHELFSKSTAQGCGYR